ncbi:MAG TPA: nucleotide exchange factor GrpE [Bacillales bacterium]|nr:nucleotide exchange factor GrpE [Bacillales bacterium]
MTEEKKDQTIEENEDIQTEGKDEEVLANDSENKENGTEAEPEVVEATDMKDADANVEQLEKEKEELKKRLLRVQADYDNFRRRTREESAAAAKYRAQGFAEKLLPAFDSFERALDVKVESEEAKSLLKGLEIVHRQLKDAFEQENIREIEAEGKPFDPQYHQAVMQVEEEGAEPNTVVEVMQKGYVLNDRVIRPAMVKVTS